MFGSILSPLSFLPALKTLLVVAVLSAAFIWWRSRGSKDKGETRLEEGSGSRKGAPTTTSSGPGVDVAALARQLRLVAEDVERARKETSRGGQQMYLYGARQRLETIAAAVGGNEEALARISVRANLSIDKLSGYVEKALALMK
jgi:hypothetical protein